MAEQDPKKPAEKPVKMVVIAGEPWIDGAPRGVGAEIEVDAGLAEHLAEHGLAKAV